MPLCGHELLEAYVKDHADKAWRLAVGMMGNPADAEDVVQEAFLTVAGMIDRAPADRPWPWLATVVCNAARNAQRKRTRRRKNVTTLGDDIDPPDSGADGPGDAMVDAEMAAIVRDELARLPEAEREALAATHLTGMSQSEAAEALGLPLGTVKTRVRRGLDVLRERLGRRLNRPGWDAEAGNDTHHAAIAKALSVAVIAEPAGGMAQAIMGWTAAAKVGLPLAGATGASAGAASATTATTTSAGAVTTAAASTGATIVTSNALIFNVACVALVIGLGAGAIGLGPLFVGDLEAPPPVTIDNPATLRELSEARQQLSGKSDELTRINGLLSEEQRLRGQREAELAAIGREMSGIKGMIQAKDTEIAEMRKGFAEMGRALEEAKAAKQPEPAAATTVDAQAARVKAQQLLGELKALLEKGNDKNAIAAKLDEMKVLGIAAANEFYDAYLAVSEKGSPYGGKNDLNWSTVEFNGLMPWEFVEYAVGDGVHTAPAGIKIHAMQWHASDPRIPAARRLQVIGEELDRANPETAPDAVECLGRLNTKGANPYLLRAAANATFDRETRVRAVTTAMRTASDDDMQTIAALEKDANQHVSDAAWCARMWKSPEATGFLVSWVNIDGPADRAGVRLGDIITRINGSAVTTLDSMKAAFSQTSDNQVIVTRRGQPVTLSLTLVGGVSGLSGKSVTKP